MTDYNLVIMRRKAMRAMLAELADYFQIKIPVHVIDLYVEDLSKVPMPVLHDAILFYRTDPQNTRYPRPAELVPTHFLPRGGLVVAKGS